MLGNVAKRIGIENRISNTDESARFPPRGLPRVIRSRSVVFSPAVRNRANSCTTSRRDPDVEEAHAAHSGPSRRRMFLICGTMARRLGPVPVTLAESILGCHDSGHSLPLVTARRPRMCGLGAGEWVVTSEPRPVCAWSTSLTVCRRGHSTFNERLQDALGAFVRKMPGSARSRRQVEGATTSATELRR